MNGKELIKYILDNKLENKNIIVGCEGYTNKARVIKESNNSIFIVDECYYQELEEAKNL